MSLAVLLSMGFPPLDDFPWNLTSAGKRLFGNVTSYSLHLPQNRLPPCETPIVSE
jgi:hypothetical protein